MPVHDWTRVEPNLFHAFHQGWIIAVCNALNEGGLPADFMALPEQSVGPVPDVLTLRREPSNGSHSSGGSPIQTVPMKTRFTQAMEADPLIRRINRVSVRHVRGEIVAVIEIVSPANKNAQVPFETFVRKIAGLLHGGIHVMVLDLFPPGARDPAGIYNAICLEMGQPTFTPPEDKPLTVVSYDAGDRFAPTMAYVEPFAVGDVLPDMPLYLLPDHYVPAPLEATYQTAWGHFPNALKGLLEPPAAG